jgi:hypothetical protein
MKQWQNNIIINIALLYYVFGKVCKQSAIFYLLTFLFFGVQFHYIFATLFILHLLIFTLAIETNKEFVQTEFKKVLDKHFGESNKKES